MKKNNRNDFYKYVSPRVTKLVIENQKIKWSAPSLFNDPFDHRFNFLDVDFDKFKVKFIKRFEELIFDSDKPIITTTEQGQMLYEIRLNRRNLPRDEFKEKMKEFTDNFSETSKQILPIMQKEVNDFLSKSRVLCLTKNHENLLMWSHYGPSHTGAVFRFDIDESMDINLSLAQPVEYKAVFPSIATEEEWIDNFLCVKDINFGERYYKAICTKSTEWEYEKEWRLSIYGDDNEPDGSGYLQYPKDIFGALYLGLKMKFEDKRDIVTLAEKHLPSMEIWEANIRKNEFKLDFQRTK